MAKSLVKNAADSGQVNTAKEKAKLNRDVELDDIRTICKLEAGQRLIWRYLEMAKVFSSTFTGDLNTYFLEGKRSLGLQLLSDINEADPTILFKLLVREREKDFGNSSERNSSDSE